MFLAKQERRSGEIDEVLLVLDECLACAPALFGGASEPHVCPCLGMTEIAGHGGAASFSNYLLEWMIGIVHLPVA